MGVVLLLLSYIIPNDTIAQITKIQGEDYDTKITIQIKTSPPNATFNLTSIDHGIKVQGMGDAIYQLPQGSYQLEVSARGYLTHREFIATDEDVIKKQVILREAFSKIELKLNPEDARIELDGKIVKTKTFNISVAQDHRIKITHPDYEPREFTLYSEFPETIIEDVFLEPKMSTIHYKVHPPDATIEIDGRPHRALDGPIKIAPGVRNIRIHRIDFFDFVEERTIAPNQDYPFRVVNLDEDSRDVPPSDKKLTARIEYNPLSAYGSLGRFHMVPFAVHLEWRYLSVGYGIDRDSQTQEKEDENQKKYKRTKDYRDTYIKVRLILPRIWDNYKFYVTGIDGTKETEYKNFFDQRPMQKKIRYQGAGLGVRAYISPVFSFHAEYHQITTRDQEQTLRQKESRTMVGLGFEF